MEFDNSLEFLKLLIKKKSITPEDDGCQDLIESFLKPLGFNRRVMNFNNVQNSIYSNTTSGKSICFLGHTDVVPPGEIKKWNTDPFDPQIKSDVLYGRGASDMKSSIVSFLFAVKEFVHEVPNHKLNLNVALTSDEEGVAEFGIRKVTEVLLNEKINFDYCIVGEPTSENKVGDMIKIGRRGSLSGNLTIIGKRGHVAYPNQAINPIHTSSKFINDIINCKWDKGNDDFPPTSFQISNVHAGDGANNVIPEEIKILFNFRYSPETTVIKLKEKVLEILERHQIEYKIDWSHSGEPFYTKKGKLTEIISRSIEKHTKIHPTLSTIGGTSDGRFFKDVSSEIVEFGVTNKTIHSINECVNIHDVTLLSKIYKEILIEINKQ